MTKKLCPYCKERPLLSKRNSKTCGDPECQREHKRELDRKWRQIPEVKERKSELQRKRRQIPGVKEYYREYYREYDRKRRQIPEAKERKRERKRKRYQRPEVMIESRIRRGVNRAFCQYSTTGKLTNSKYYGIDYPAIVRKLEATLPGPREKYHIDHVVPCSAFNHNNPLEVKACWHPYNLQWLTDLENMAKHARYRKKDKDALIRLVRAEMKTNTAQTGQDNKRLDTTG